MFTWERFVLAKSMMLPEQILQSSQLIRGVAQRVSTALTMNMKSSNATYTRTERQPEPKLVVFCVKYNTKSLIALPTFIEIL